MRSERISQPKPTRKLVLPLCLCMWLAAISTGIGFLWSYGSTPGQASIRMPEQWPADSGIQRAASGRSTVLLFSHPRCPCTRASMRELMRLMARCEGRLEAVVILSGAVPADDKLFADARATPGVRVVNDFDRVESRRFDANTSGQTMLYDANGQLVFKGGITAARGHEGDNPGSEMIVQLANAKPSETAGRAIARTPVFGCAIEDK